MTPRQSIASLCTSCAIAALGIFFWYGIIDGQWNQIYPIITIFLLFISGVARSEKPVRISHQLIGVRGFRFGSNGELLSLTNRGAWVKGENIAICAMKGSSHEAPDASCHCGFNVWHSIQDLRHSGYHYDVAAVVEGWGKARLHTDGWRSNKARIVALIDEECSIYATSHGDFYTAMPKRQLVRPHKRIELEAASLRYDIPIVSAAMVENALDEFGTPVPAKLRPKGVPRWSR